MKKTLFLSAILATALCSSAFGALTINVGAGEQVTQGGVNTSDGSASTINSLGELTINGRLYFENNSTATFTATGEAIKSTVNGFWLQLQGDSNPASASLLAHSGATATYNATGDIAVYKNSTLTIGSGVTLNTRGIYYSSDNTANNGKVQLEDNAHVNLTKKSVFHDLVIGSNSSVSNTAETLADTVTMAGSSSLSLSSSTINNLTVTGSDNTFSSASASGGSSSITTLTVNADSALSISNTTLKVGALALSGNLSLNSQTTLNLGHLGDLSHVTLNNGSTLHLTLGETDRISETPLTHGNGLGSAQYTYTYAGPQMNGGQLKLNGAAASISDGVLSGSNGTYYINDAASFTGHLDNHLEGATNLVINNGTVTTVNDSSNGLVSGDIVVNAATLSVTGSAHDAFGYYKASATKSITLNGTDANHKAILDLDYTNSATVTMTTNLVMNGNAEVSGTRGINTYRDGDGTGNITASGANNDIKVAIQIRQDATVTVNDNSALTLSGEISQYRGATGTLTKAGNGTLTITGNITGGTINGANKAKTTISGNTISGGTISNATISNSSISGGTISNATIRNSSISTGSYNLANVDINDTAFTGNVTLTGGQRTVGSNLTYTLANGAEVDASDVRMWLQDNATLSLQNTTVDGTSTGGTVTMQGLLFGPGRAISTASAGNLSIAKDTTLRITGENGGGTDTNNGFMIWNGKAHVVTINGTLQIDNIIRADSMLSGQTITASATQFNVGGTGTLMLAKGITFSGSNASLTSLGTINVAQNGTLAIGGQTTGSKAASVTLEDGATVVALDKNTYTEQVFSLHYQNTINFSSKGLDGTADNTLTIHSNINQSDAAVNSIGKVNFGDMNIVRLKVDGTTTTGTLTTNNLIMEAGASLTMSSVGKTLDTLTLNSGSKVTLGSENDHDNDLTTSGLVVNGDAKLNANLVVNSGKMEFTAGAVLTMGCDVTIGDGVKVYITGDIAAIRHGLDTVTIINGLTSLDEAYLGNADIYVNNTLQSDFFLDTVEDSENGGYKIVVAPEPATATLSLLALAGLCARRRRH